MANHTDIIAHAPAVTSTTEALEALLTEYGISASNDYLYKNAIFGRDSLEVAEDILAIYPEIARQTITILAGLQGTTYNHITEEEPGRIHHEHRSMKIGDTRHNPDSQRILKTLAAKWGGTASQMTYYATVDATPLFIRLIDRYCQLYDKGLLDHHLTNKDGQQISIRQALGAAVDWLVNRLEKSPLGLLEYRRSNPIGIKNQAWKDSDEFYTHVDGTPCSPPIASIEAQGLAYDALLAACHHFPDQKDHLRQLAAKLQHRVLTGLWLEDEHYFGLGFDYDPAGNPRIIHTRTANPAELLDTTIFDNVAEVQKERYISAIINTIFDGDFLTSAGVRSRALSQAKIIPYWDYHGSYVSWPKETYDIAKGLRRQGFLDLAKLLEDRLHHIAHLTADYPEFVYVDEHGNLLFPQRAPGKATDAIVYGTISPESVQAWTVSAIVGIDHAPSIKTVIHLWQRQLSQHILGKIPAVFTPSPGHIRYFQFVPVAASSHTSGFPNQQRHEA